MKVRRIEILSPLVLMSWLGTASARDDVTPVAEPTSESVSRAPFIEIDPLPFALGGYGVQVGVRPEAWRGLRVAIASFSLELPDAVASLGENEGFHVEVRPSLASYILYYPAASRRGFAFGGALRLLRLRYRRDGSGETATVSEFSPELIVGYKWHPFSGAEGFYAQPWLGLSRPLWSSGAREVGDETYEPLPVQPFATLNLGYEFSL